MKPVVGDRFASHELEIDAALLESLLEDALEFSAACERLAPHLRRKAYLIAEAQRSLFELTQRSIGTKRSPARRRGERQGAG